MGDLIERLNLIIAQCRDSKESADLWTEVRDEIERLWAVVDEMPCAYHDIRASDKGQCFCGDCAGPPCDCPKHEALAALETDDGS